MATKAGMKIVGFRKERCEFPLDLFWSVRRSLLSLLVYPLYPLFKLVSAESLTVIYKRGDK